MQRALQSSDDVNAALKEALKVQNVETLIGGLGAELENTFKTFERAANDNLATARKYGLDVVALEKITAEQRVKVFNDTLASRVGSLQSLLTDLASGDLFEGSIADQRSALLAQLGKAKTDATAGVDGAADTVANIGRQLLELDRNGFGTAGPEYANDRSSIADIAQQIISVETDRVKAAQDQAEKLSSAAEATAANTDENNDQNSTIIALLNQLVAQGGAPPGGAPPGGGNIAYVGRTVSL